VKKESNATLLVGVTKIYGVEVVYFNKRSPLSPLPKVVDLPHENHQSELAGSQYLVKSLKRETRHPATLLCWLDGIC
jgi:hypothetical protein